ncbi:CYTH and CHAD domain-containing protein [Candidatus Nitronereus thalassa]|uniref:CYTH and CHAD domain-containing protein n=1 Tax=Candidatus Nitronereus thalassa TaxID=3020898 RepID=A0ABU3K9R0_9BACT|nr:CYTH and CHAD domain-containing protein [Candidatus Nitronereus thalassa]MDT7043184.1 CYTH and CHAD domain-containing protein [Candidatus Nitronereus thalassa]
MEYQLREWVEHEIKLNIGSRFRLPDIPGDTLAPRVFTSTYFDTAGHRLARLGISLRRLTDHRKTRWQLKLPHKRSRLELEIPSHHGTPPEPFLDLLFGLLRNEPCEVIAKLRTKRSGIRAQTMEGPLATIVVDRVTILDGRRAIGRFSEIEIERLGGNEKEMNRLKSLLRSAGAEEGDPRPKIVKVLGIQPDSTAPTVAASAPPLDHFKVMIENQVKELLLHDPGTRFGKDPEELHRMRVSTRKFRALLRAAKVLLLPEWSNSLRTEMGWLGQALGAVRDYDVLLAHLQLEASSLLPAEKKIFCRVLISLETKRSVARAHLLEALRSDRYLKLLNYLEEAVHHPMPSTTEGVTLKEIARKEFNKLRRMVRQLKSNPSDQELHRVRIRTKRARYAAELAQRTMEKAVSRYIKQSKRLQGVLGDHQDAIIAEKQLRELLPGIRSYKSAFVMGQVVARLHSRRQQARAAFPQEWEKLKKRGRLAFSEPS